MLVPLPRLLVTLLVLLATVPVAGAAAAPRPLPAPSLPSTYLLTPTDQLGFPGHRAGALVTPEGDLFTGWAEATFTLGGTESFEPRSHTLQDGRYPIVHLFKVVSGVLYELDAFQAPVGGTPVVFARISVKNLRGRRARARVAAGLRYDGSEFGARYKRCCVRIYRFPRPIAATREGLYDQPGAIFNPAWAYTLTGSAQGGSTLLRDNLAVLLFQGGDSRTQVSQSLQSEPPPANGRTEFGRTVYDISLGARERHDLVFRMPVEPVAPTDPAWPAIESARFDQYRGIVLGYWRNLLGRAMRVILPEPKVVDTFYASIVGDAMARYQVRSGYWMQLVNQLRYHAFWLRDAAIISNMYDLVGLHDLATQNLDYFPSWQRDDGLLISRPEEYDGFGQSLWVMGEHVRRTGDASFARRMLPTVVRAMAWFDAQRANEPTGLMPPNVDLKDNEQIRGHLAGDNFWAAAGVAGAVDLARAAGDGASATRWQATYDAFTTRLKGHIFNAQRVNGGAIPPSLDFRGGQDWGNLWASYPHRVLDPSSAVVGNTLKRVRMRFREGIATYADAQLLHHYLGFRVFQTELLRGEQGKVVQGLYDELAHTTGTGAGFEAGTAPFGDRIVDDATVPHGWFAAEYAALVRNMLVREEGNDVWLMSAVSPAWLRPGRRVSVASAPTTRGTVAYTLLSTKGGATLTWKSEVRPGTRLRWPVPYAARDVRAPGLNRRTGLITLVGRSGRLTVRWRLVGQDPTFEGTFAGLMRAYFNSPNGAVEAGAAGRRRTLPATPSCASSGC